MHRRDLRPRATERNGAPREQEKLRERHRDIELGGVPMERLALAIWLTLTAAMLAGCSDERHVAPLPDGFPALPVPAGNTLTDARVNIGKRLFYDRQVARKREVSCSSCHLAENAYAGPNRFSIGVEGRLRRRNAPCRPNAGRRSPAGPSCWPVRPPSPRPTRTSPRWRPRSRRRKHVQRLLSTPLTPSGQPKREVPTFETFGAEFMATYCESHNKPSEIASKTSVLKNHLGPSSAAHD